MAQAGLALINLEDQGAFVFQFFPRTLTVTDRANWNAQETTTGVKPLFYANREPRSIEFPELYLDNTETNQSLTDDIKRLRDLQVEVENKGKTARVAGSLGRQKRAMCFVGTDNRGNFFNTEGEPLRVKISLSLIQLQPDEGEAVGVRT